jgi:hypothetical protein
MGSIPILKGWFNCSHSSNNYPEENCTHDCLLATCNETVFSHNVVQAQAGVTVLNFAVVLRQYDQSAQ